MQFFRLPRTVSACEHLASKKLAGEKRLHAGNAPTLLGTLWHGCYFDGQWRAGAQALEVTEPATGEWLARVGMPQATQVAELAARALLAQRGWAATPPAERMRILRRAAALLEQHAAEATSWVIRESGSVPMKSAMEVQATADEFHVAAGLLIQAEGLLIPSHSPDATRLSLMRRVPLGVVAVIAPWNVPLGLAIRSVAPALALGNAVILKPDPHTPVSGGVLLARVLEQAGLPAGVFTMLPGGAEIGEALVTAPAVRMVSFTGSTAAGRRVGELAGKHLKKVLLELGGNSPLLVLADADLDAAASAGAFGSFFHQGQICMATSRHIVVRSVAQAYEERLTARAAALQVGNPLQAGVHIGPMINRKQIERVDDLVTRSVTLGARIMTGGKHDQHYYQPTVLTQVTASMPAFTEEIFGPVAPVTIADDVEHAVALANDTAYGLSAAVFSGSMDIGLQVARQLRAGMVHVNDQTINDCTQAPMGGMGQSGNGGRFSCLTAWDEFTEWQWTTASSTPARYPF